MAFCLPASIYTNPAIVFTTVTQASICNTSAFLTCNYIHTQNNKQLLYLLSWQSIQYCWWTWYNYNCNIVAAVACYRQCLACALPQASGSLTYHTTTHFEAYKQQISQTAPYLASASQYYHKDRLTSHTVGAMKDKDTLLTSHTHSSIYTIYTPTHLKIEGCYTDQRHSTKLCRQSTLTPTDFKE